MRVSRTPPLQHTGALSTPHKQTNQTITVLYNNISNFRATITSHLRHPQPTTRSRPAAHGSRARLKLIFDVRGNLDQLDRQQSKRPSAPRQRVYPPTQRSQSVVPEHNPVAVEGSTFIPISHESSKNTLLHTLYTNDSAHSGGDSKSWLAPQFMTFDKVLSSPSLKISHTGR